MQKHINYEKLIDISMHNIVKEALKTIENSVLPGKHHFYLSFSTQAPGVLIPEHLKLVYPNEMTIVLQYQFEDLEVRANDFSVSLTFNGKRSHLTIPYKALTSFTDPSVNFALKFKYFQRTLKDNQKPEDLKQISTKSTLKTASKTLTKSLETKTTTNNIIQFSKLKKPQKG
jgi:hypothetical protein